jgi:integrative and conjugative element protein (TIGR02256 family)
MQLTSSFYKHPIIKYDENKSLYGNDKIKITISRNVLEMLKLYRQIEVHQHEKGGILIGIFKENNIDIIDLTHPFPLDRSSRYAFHREDPMHDKILQAKWSLSGKQLGLLGDWHTHPEVSPTASGIDLKGWSQQLQREHPYVFLIQGTKSLSVYCTHA